MARKRRIEFAGAVYHILSRGDHGENIYQDDEDRKGFLRCLGEVGNTRSKSGSGMKWLQGVYTQRFNRRHKLRGHLFQGRYKALTNCGKSCLDQPKIENGGCLQGDAGGECGGCK